MASTEGLVPITRKFLVLLRQYPFPHYLMMSLVCVRRFALSSLIYSRNLHLLQVFSCLPLSGIYMDDAWFFICYDDDFYFEVLSR
ncbi:unnamed protein product [Linum tenue]|uniref:Uncharacterized protein n=1 Tax=Linum tenue TaxID=586396 RepID=A0AAV0Q480_9ROSI|nr:unnamed protein product [Linum tenue]